MSLEQMLSVLMRLGVSRADSLVYIFLAAKIPQSASDIAEALRIRKHKLYPCLANLQEIGIVSCTGDRPKRYIALPIENAIERLVKANLEEADSIEQNREKILSYWKTMVRKNSAQNPTS